MVVILLQFEYEGQISGYPQFLSSSKSRRRKKERKKSLKIKNK